MGADLDNKPTPAGEQEADYSDYEVHMQYDTGRNIVTWLNSDGHPFRQCMRLHKGGFIIYPFRLDHFPCAPLYSPSKAARASLGRLDNPPIALTHDDKYPISENDVTGLCLFIDQWNRALSNKDPNVCQTVDRVAKRLALGSKQRYSEQYKGMSFTGVKVLPFE